MTTFTHTNFQLSQTIAADAVISGDTSRSELTSGTVIERIESDYMFDEIVRSLGRLILVENNLTTEDIDDAVAPLYQPLTRKPTIAGRLADVPHGALETVNRRYGIVVPAYKPPISDDRGFIHDRTLSIWAVKRYAPLVAGTEGRLKAVPCTIYQPSSRPHLLKYLGRSELFDDEQSMVDRLKSDRKILRSDT